MNKVKNNVPMTIRPLHVIAHEIKRDWNVKMYFGAKPYVDAMQCLNTMNDNYGSDSARTIVVYFLANAQTWKGDVARSIKLELNAMVLLQSYGTI